MKTGCSGLSKCQTIEFLNKTLYWNYEKGKLKSIVSWSESCLQVTLLIICIDDTELDFFCSLGKEVNKKTQKSTQHMNLKVYTSE